MSNITHISRILSTAAMMAAFLGSTAAVAAPYVYIPVGNAGQIQVVDVATGEIIDTYDGLEAVHGLAGTPDGKFLVAGSYSEREMGSTAPQRPASVSAEDHAVHHPAKASDRVKPDDNMISTVTILRQETGEIMRAVDVPGAVHHVSVSPDGRFAVVTQPGNDTITAIDLETYAVVATLNTGSLPNYMTFGKDSRVLYVSNAGDNNIAVIDTADWRIDSTIAVGESPEHMVLSADGGKLFVNNIDDGSVGSVDLATGQVTDTYVIGERLHGLDLSDDGNALLVAERDGDRVARVDLATGLVSKRDMAPEPYHVTSIPGTGLVFVSSSDEPVMRVVSQSDLSLVSKIDIADVGHQMVVAQNR